MFVALSNYWARIRARFSDPARWKQSLYDLTLWFLFGLAVTQGLKMYSPGYPILVGTPSIPTGLYWVNTTSAGHMLKRGEYVSFPVRFKQDWLKARYGAQLVHTKAVIGFAGDVVQADAEGNLKICSPEGECLAAGTPLPQDSKGRVLHSWLPPKQMYTLQPGEVWVFGEHPRSLDSRYHGPVPTSDLKGRATPVLLFALG